MIHLEDQRSRTTVRGSFHRRPLYIITETHLASAAFFVLEKSQLCYLLETQFNPNYLSMCFLSTLVISYFTLLFCIPRAAVLLFLFFSKSFVFYFIFVLLPCLPRTPISTGKVYNFVFLKGN